VEAFSMRPLLLPVLPSVRAAGAAFLLCFSAPALAADGVLEINQACATQTGCFAGDTAGFPVTISAAAGASSFRLTGDLTVQGANDTGILVQTAHVKIDLGGFTIRGPALCSGAPWTCVPTGTGDGVGVSSSNVQSTEVRNGAVTGMGRRGVYVSTNGVVENVRATHNGVTGVLGSVSVTLRGVTASFNGNQGIVISSGTIEGCTVLSNAGIGLHADSSVVVTGNNVRGNGATGILVNGGSVVSHNSVRDNGDLGINATYTTVSDNSVFGNGGHGINCSSCVVIDNSTGSNGTGATGSGIWCGAGCTVRGNSSVGNAQYGLHLGSPTGYRENVVSSNGVGGVSGGTNQGNNLCSGNGVVSSACP